MLLSFAAAPSAQAASPPKWKLTVIPNADYIVSGNPDLAGNYVIEAENVGGQETSGEVVLEDHLPAALGAERAHFFDTEIGAEARSPEQNLGPSLCPSLSECRFPGSFTTPGGKHVDGLKPGQKLVMLVVADVPSAGFEGPLPVSARVSGGGAAAAAEASAANAASPDPPFGLLGFGAALTDSSAHSYTQAGGHPAQLSTEFNFETFSAPATIPGNTNPLEAPATQQSTAPLRDPMHVSGELPPGLLANPQAVPTCSLADWYAQACEAAKVDVGVACLRLEFNTLPACHQIVPVYNLQPNGSNPGELGIPYGGTPLAIITAGLRTGSDYGISATSIDPEVALTRVKLTLWGVPAAAEHNALRAKFCTDTPWRDTGAHFASVAELESLCAAEPGGSPPAPGVKETPFLTMPTECSGRPLTIVGRYDTWQVPGEYAERSAEFEPVDACNQLAGLFKPTIEARPTTDLADSPSGLEFNLKVPQHEECQGGSCEPATPSLKEAVVKLPQGLTVNPSSGNGLGACAPEQIGLRTPVGVTPAHFYETPARCPEQAAIGTAEVNTPLLHNPLQGVVYLATPHQNPFGSLLAAYIVLEGEGLIIKLPGKIEADPQTGQLTGKFLENPQTPFEDFHLDFFGGARGDLRTPATCGEYETTSVLTPYSYPESGPRYEKATSTFETEFGPGGEGSPCPTTSPSEQPNRPIFHAGTESPEAGRYTPFSLRLAREDGSQEISKIDTTLPPGLVGKLAGVGECSDAQLAVAQSREHEGGGQEERESPSCPANTEVGTVEVGAGAGPTPLYVTGHAYLAGPYKSAPLSLAIITPAVAGPFDLGTVVVRTALNVDPFTAQIRAVSDEIPHILQGIPLDVRSVTLKMNRPEFTLNPTNCEELGFTGAATSLLGNVAPLTQRFQVGGCNTLKFKPKLKISLKGKTTRAQHPALKAVLTMKPGEANIAKAQVTLPGSAFLDQGHIKTVCTRPQLASQTCPAGSIYGHATAVTPLLDQPLSGPVYLGVGFGHKLPDLVADLNGQIRVLLHGKVDTGREHGLRNTFEVVPDAPVSKFTLEMQGGKKGLIVNSESLCSPKTKTKAIADFTAQNGKIFDTEPVVQNSCRKKGRKGHGHKRHRRAG